MSANNDVARSDFESRIDSIVVTTNSIVVTTVTENSFFRHQLGLAAHKSCEDKQLVVDPSLTLDTFCCINQNISNNETKISNRNRDGRI